MLSYRNEAAFSKAVVTTLRNKGWFIQRIESGETGKGIPDIYAIMPNKVAVWLELKRIHKEIHPYDISFEVTWRPGQQSWLSSVVARGQHAYTLCCFNNIIFQIYHDRIYKENKVLIQSCVAVKSVKELA